MKKIYIHVGTHKTGSTALQVFLTQNRNVLKDMGYVYPTIGCPENSPYGQHELAWSFFQNENFLPLFDNKRFIKDLEKLKVEIQDLNNILLDSKTEFLILSSEEFSIFSEEEIQNFTNYFKDYQIEIFFYLRRQDYYLESAYGTSILYSGYTKNFNSFISNQRMNLNYYEVIKNWEKYTSKVHVFSYEDKNIKKDIVSHFLKTTNIYNLVKDSKNIEKHNKSIGVDGIEFIRGLRLRGISENELSRIRTKLEIHYANYSKEELGRFINKEIFENISNNYSEFNNKLFEDYSCDIRFKDNFNSLYTLKDFESSLIKITLNCLDNLPNTIGN